MPEPQEDFPVFEFDQAALDKQMAKIMGTPPQVELPESPTIDDLDSWRAKAAEDARNDIIRIQGIGQALVSDLDHVDVEQLGTDLFGLPARKITRARQSAEAVMRAREYLELAIREGPSTVQRTREYAKAATQAWAAKSAADAAAFESRARSLVTDATTARAQLDELGRVRRELEQEQQADSSGQRALEISNALVRLGEEETILRLRILASENTSGAAGVMRELQALDETVSETVKVTLPKLVDKLLTLERRRHRLSVWLRRMYAAGLFGYVLAFIAIGVGADALLAHTPEAGIWLSLAAAFILFAVDRLVISPRLERWSKRKNVRLLKGEVAVCANTLAQIRLSQVDIDVMASYTGVPKKQLLNTQLMA